MPTPFSHLVAIEKLLHDEQVPAVYRDVLNAERPAYLLGAVAPDARVDAPDSRAATHFYTYQDGITEHPWRIMLRRYNTSFVPPYPDDRRAFVAGYVAHLAMDEIWTVHMLGPHFAFGDWGENQKARFFVLHLLLIDMDERDLDALPAYVPPEIECAEPAEGWLPFMPLEVMVDWQRMIFDQIRLNGESQTLPIFGERVNRTPAQLRALADDPAWMQANVWDNVPRQVLHTVEAQMYVHARESLVAFLDEHTLLTRE
ncbi:MAG: hypothetical protein AAF125_04080 [Chloroflexota bacterium]